MTPRIPSSPTDSEMKLSSKPSRDAKGRKPCHRASQKHNVYLSHDHDAGAAFGRKQRVWKACERCRMKKTKCDGEYPCKRCKDDSMVCTMGSRKRKELQQLPTGYIDFLENTHYALIAAVEKLYKMVHNGESWDLVEPEINDCGQVVVHSIAERLGCLRPSTNRRGDTEDFAELQARLKVEKSDEMERDHFTDSISSPEPTSTIRATSSDSDESEMLEEYMQMPLDQQQHQYASPHLHNSDLSTQIHDDQFEENLLFQTEFAEELENMSKESANFNLHGQQQQHHISPPYSCDSQSPNTAQSQPYLNNTPFCLWPYTNDFLTPANMLEMSSLYLQQQQLLASGGATIATTAVPRSMDPASISCSGSAHTEMTNGTIQPHLLHRDSGYSPAGTGANVFYNDYEATILNVKGAGGLDYGVSFLA